jgi:hypothetical protein
MRTTLKIILPLIVSVTAVSLMKQTAACGGNTEVECLGLQSAQMLGVCIARI